jgi:hypothetical protein
VNSPIKPNSSRRARSPLYRDYEAFIKQTLADLAKVPQVDVVLDAVLADPRLIRRGMWVEFGIFEGRTLRKMSTSKGDATVWGVDSFRGLPEPWGNTSHGQQFPTGSYSVGHVPLIDGANLLVGLFDEVLPSFNPNTAVTLAHVDSDLYSSANSALGWLHTRTTPGTVIVFDELKNYEGFEEGEMKALYEWALQTDTVYEWIYNGKDEQAALRIL